ncbi:Cytoplasmic glyoxalase II [Thecaphora frezii]
MKIIPVPVRSDNYAYIILSPASAASEGKGGAKAAFVDPFDLEKVTSVARQHGVEDGDVVALLTTHHHQDHSGGNGEFAKRYPNLPIYGGSSQVPGLTSLLTHQQRFPLFPNVDVTALSTPCHTQDSICYYLHSPTASASAGEVEHAVFTGDTLFISGCGRFFEGTAAEMHTSLSTLASLPPTTLVYCGHEYTASNVAFTKQVLGDDEHVKRLVKDVEEGRNGGVFTGVYTIEEEKRHNAFMRVEDEAVMRRVGAESPVKAMEKLRTWKNEGKVGAVL